MYSLGSPGKVNLVGSPYVIVKCPEIEALYDKQRAAEKYGTGLVKIPMTSFGYNYVSVPLQDEPTHLFKPVSVIPRLSFRVENQDGGLYSFEGLNLSFTLEIWVYKFDSSSFSNFTINPHYNPHDPRRF